MTKASSDMNLDLAGAIDKQLRRHDAFVQMDRFGRLARSRPMTALEREKFLASLWVFFEEVPTGILALGLNICDVHRLTDPWQATELAAKVLTANVDEFGLRKAGDQTHHQLFIALANRLGLTATQLRQSRHIFASAYRLACTTRNYYRSPDILLGIGLHLASELTSSVEFGHFDAAFRTHACEYGIEIDSGQDPFFFFRIHTLVEPEHYASAVELAVQVAGQVSDDALLSRLISGATAFLDDFSALFEDFNEMLSERA
ncbi:MAG: hypothetical protein JF606_28960 [Burkholderiales bacterium]|jgi:hypothetical protein|nr:hypothetical protein [Burkholderiales bacterium]